MQLNHMTQITDGVLILIGQTIDFYLNLISKFSTNIYLNGLRDILETMRFPLIVHFFQQIRLSDVTSSLLDKPSSSSWFKCNLLIVKLLDCLL